MNLREKVAEAIHNYDSHPHWKPWSELSDASRSIRLGYGDAAISAVFDALLSDTAVEAGSIEMFREEIRLEEETGFHEDGPWSMPTYRTVMRKQIKAAQAALTADAAQTGGE